MSQQINEAKKTVKLVDYIQGDKTKKGKITYVNPCPKCGHKDHFVIYENTNTYYSFNSCCNGGSIVDYMIEVENHSNRKEACSLLLKMSGMYRPENINKKTSSCREEEELKKNKLKRLNTIYHIYCVIEREIRSKLQKKESLVARTILSFIERQTNFLMTINTADISKFDKYLKNFNKIYKAFHIELNNAYKAEKQINQFKKELSKKC